MRERARTISSFSISITLEAKLNVWDSPSPELWEHQRGELSFKCRYPCISDLRLAFSVVICSALKFGKLFKIHVNRTSQSFWPSFYIIQDISVYFSSCLRFLKQEKYCIHDVVISVQENRTCVRRRGMFPSSDT